MHTDLMNIIEGIGPMAKNVGELAKAQNAAFNEKTIAETELLDAVIARTRPGLRAVSSRIQSSYRTWWPDNTSPVEEQGYLEERGLRVNGDGAELDHPRANCGEYAGEDLYLLPDGAWLEVSYSGHWSCWQGAISEWTTETRSLTTRDVAAKYPVVYIVRALEKALRKQVDGRRAKATERALQRAETLRAVTALLGGRP